MRSLSFYISLVSAAGFIVLMGIAHYQSRFAPRVQSGPSEDRFYLRHQRKMYKFTIPAQVLLWIAVGCFFGGTKYGW